MSFRTTAFLLLVLALLGGYVYTSVLNQPPARAPDRPFVYRYDMADIVRIDVQHGGERVDVVLDPEKEEWRFADPSRGNVDASRLNGTRLLLSGPGANRVLLAESPTPAQLAEYGFNQPQVRATITLKDGTTHQVLLGDQTPDGRNYYTKNAEGGPVYLVDYTWGDEIKRFVTEPPIAKAEAGA